MTAAPRVPAAADGAIWLEDLRIGDLLAEGGEGRVFELPLQPHLVIKRYRRPSARQFLDDLVAWPDRVTDAGLAARVRAATAWPAATVMEANGSAPGSLAPAAAPTAAALPAAAPPGHPAPTAAALPVAAGVLLPRAPRRFALRHRDGTTRLATLSYLTADPAHGAVAYGLSLPEPAGPERLGLVYALARVLEAFESTDPVVGHGDLSSKNVLWSLQRGPEVFVIDCDNCERFDPDGRPLAEAGRRRATTPNWEDPAVLAGANPTLASDRYSLALIFLRVVGAANFPIQARQRQGGPITVDFPVPPGRFGEALLAPDAPLWELCGRGLSVSDPARRPPASAWLAALEAVLDALGAASVMRSVWAAQGGGAPSAAAALQPWPGPHDVVIRPVRASPRPAPRRTLVLSTAPGSSWVRSGPLGAGATVSGPGGGGPGSGGVGAAGGAVVPRPGASGAGVTGPGGPLATSARVAGGSAWTGPGRPGSGVSAGAASANGLSPPVGVQTRAYLAQAGAWWAALHRHMLRALWTSGHRVEGVRRLAACVVVDLVLALIGLFVVGMIVSPVLGI